VIGFEIILKRLLKGLNGKLGFLIFSVKMEFYALGCGFMNEKTIENGNDN
jgi:hypothetical protein